MYTGPVKPETYPTLLLSCFHHQDSCNGPRRISVSQVIFRSLHSRIDTNIIIPIGADLMLASWLCCKVSRPLCSCSVLFPGPPRMSCPPPAPRRQSAHLHLGPKYLSGGVRWDDKGRNTQRKTVKATGGLSITGTLTNLVHFN